MKIINQKLTSEFLESIGFKFDGYYWVHSNFVFRLTKASDKDAYIVDIPGISDPNQLPPPASCYCELFRVILGTLNMKLDQIMQGYTDIKDQNAMISVYVDNVKKYFGFDKGLSINLILGGVSRIDPGNEYTFSLMNGVDQFRITYIVDGNEHTAEVEVHPACMSLEYALKLFITEFPDLFDKDCKQNISIKEILTNNTLTGGLWEPFYGMGMKFDNHATQQGSTAVN